MSPLVRVPSSARSLGLALVLFAFMTGTAAAQNVPTGTGCLRLSTGTLSKIKPGPAPLLPCAAGEVLARVSSGDVTAVLTPSEGGLQGGAVSGQSSLEIQPAFRLPQACAPGEIPRWTGSGWECAGPPAGGGGNGLAKLEDLGGLPCGAGSDAGTVALTINPVSRAVAIGCPRLDQFMLDVAVSGPGSVASDTPEITCGLGGGDCSHAFDAGDLVTLSVASDADGTHFQGWSGACSGDDPTCQVTMDQARQVTATFLPTLTVKVATTPTERQTNCSFGFCVTVDVFTESKARVTVTDLDTGLVAGTCDADTTVVIPFTGTFPGGTVNLTTCNIPVVSGHHLRFTAEDRTTLGGTQTFLHYQSGGCAGSTNPICEPAAAVTVHEEAIVLFQ